ncbi:UV DNA damage repair endonuclease UvsE [Bacillus sp. HMF5848]|uniref:UV DNA damage repair endonuclease UvsE n=1 Tax=Bacillus sp. HMF5848 TaxID=2495421 RepID=UPI000F78D50B|nr:UV DNA damage repair endonuclease UvsE [Bacillus sp. HMF5848]RSK25660.1 UV DNA damage repair endonuclease UvsE [Bacillus sp. HMF5848]
MTIIKLGYVAMSMELENSSPSQTMTFAQFKKIKDRDAAIRKLERIAISNLENCLRLLRHNVAHDISFFRFSSKLIPLANHEELNDWKYMRPLQESLKQIGDYIRMHPMRIGFHPDHFVLLNSPKADILNTSIKQLAMHEALLKGMDVDTKHRCVMHVGGGYDDKEKALEQFIHNWGYVPQTIQEMIILENDDTTFTIDETLYLCEKLAIPIVFDLHHHLANYNDEDWFKHWQRIVDTWNISQLAPKMHISSPRNEKEFRAHSDYVDVKMFLDFLNEVKGSVPELYCMIEAKKKDQALFKLMEDIKPFDNIEIIDGASFAIH